MVRHHRQSASSHARFVGALLVAVALVFQIFLAERHFHPVLAAKAVPVAVGSVADATLSPPSAPPSDQNDDDCALCQLLALGAASPISHGFIDWPASLFAESFVARNQPAPRREHLRGPHEARAPPLPLVIA